MLNINGHKIMQIEWLCLQNFASFLHWFFSSKSTMFSLSSEPLLSSFITLHIAGHIYTCDVATLHFIIYHWYMRAMLVCISPMSLHFTIHYPYTWHLYISWSVHFIVHCPCTCDLHIYIHTITKAQEHVCTVSTSSYWSQNRCTLMKLILRYVYIAIV